MNIARRRAIAIRIYCPVGPDTLSAVLAGDHDAVEGEAVTAALLAVIRADNPLGDFAPYRDVVEIGVGWESFTPGPAASPALGSIGQRTVSPTIILTTYAAPDADLDAALAALMAAHPWEVPVIELAEVQLLLRTPASGDGQRNL